MKKSIQFSAAKNYFLGLATSALFLISGLYFFNSSKTPEHSPLTFTDNSEAENPTGKKNNLQKFNPNDLNAEEWMNLGFSERQVATILKYKSVVGGNFTSKEQLQKCYSISTEKYSEIEPYILLPELAGKSNSYQNYRGSSKSNYNGERPSYHYTSSNKELSIPGKFNPDNYSVNDFINLGFTEKQSNSILKYKSLLGGSFISKDKFRACYMISDENYKKLAPYLLLPETAPANTFDKKQFVDSKQTPQKANLNMEPFNPNTTNFEGWKTLGFSDKQAQVIINYRDRNLKGSFKNLEDIQRCFVISAEKFEQLKPYILLNSENISPSKADNSQSSSPNSKVVNDNETKKTDFKKNKP